MFQILEVTLPKQKIKIFKRCQMTALKFRFRTITFQKGHWNYLMHKITFNGANFQWKFFTKTCVHRVTAIIFFFTNIPKPYSHEQKFRFGTFWRFLTSVLAKLLVKSEMSRIEMVFWGKKIHILLCRAKIFDITDHNWSMVGTQTLPTSMPSFSYITCSRHNCLLLSGGASHAKST